MSNKKEGKTVAAYMSRVKSLVDDLALIRHPLNDAQIMTYILNGLGDEFKELAAAIRVRDTSISFEDLYDKLLDEELICNHGKPKEEEVQVTVQLIQKGRSGRGGHHSGYNNITHSLDTNPSEKNSQPNHMQTNRQQPSYRCGKNLANITTPTQDALDSFVSPYSPPYLLPTIPSSFHSTNQHDASTP
ncbi:hypothetical protein F0562_032711 [Nyssa sinensis]|uniref:Uncharacterized protein n=1 Tax=Nyssa sinensis TaxID=561372 RepID=A0A5J5AR12_9ASTE|nr:hypothetical protein F0562_032711 [Nyssa sinensis]